MRKVFMFGTLASLYLANAQHTGRVGINTDSPNATLEVVGNGVNNTIVDGFIPPKLTGAQLKNKDALYTQNQTGAVVYVTQGLATNATTAKTINVTAQGFYYFDGNIWQKINADTSIYSNDGTLSGNRIVTMGRNSLSFSGNTTNFIKEGESVSIKPAASGQSNFIGFYKNGADSNRTAYIGYGSGGNNNLTITNTAQGGNISLESNSKITGTLEITNIPNGINTDKVLVVGNDGKVKKIDASTLDTDTNTNIYTNDGSLPTNREINLNSKRLHMKGSGILVVGGNDNNTNVNTSASLNVIGSANINNDIYAPNLPFGANTDKVLVIGGDNRIKKIEASSLSPEPWQIANTTNPATNNTQNIYQNGNVGIRTNNPNAALDISNTDASKILRFSTKPTHIGNNEDYVFFIGKEVDNGYDLRKITLSELINRITVEIPSLKKIVITNTQRQSFSKKNENILVNLQREIVNTAQSEYRFITNESAIEFLTDGVFDIAAWVGFENLTSYNGDIVISIARYSNGSWQNFKRAIISRSDNTIRYDIGNGVGGSFAFVDEFKKGEKIRLLVNTTNTTIVTTIPNSVSLTVTRITKTPTSLNIN